MLVSWPLRFGVWIGNGPEVGGILSGKRALGKINSFLSEPSPLSQPLSPPLFPGFFEHGF